MKTLTSDHFEKLTVQMSQEEKEEAKRLAKSKGMTFQGWLGQLIKGELSRAEQELTGGMDDKGNA